MKLGHAHLRIGTQMSTYCGSVGDDISAAAHADAL